MAKTTKDEDITVVWVVQVAQSHPQCHRLIEHNIRLLIHLS